MRIPLSPSLASWIKQNRKFINIYLLANCYIIIYMQMIFYYIMWVLTENQIRSLKSSKIEFTMELGKGKKINFLDIIINKISIKDDFPMYRKPSNTE